MSLEQLDPNFTAPKRLRLAAILRASVWAEFAFLQDHVGLSKTDLSKQMKHLIDAGYAESKRAGGRRGGTAWFRLTRDGASAYDQHLTALHQLTSDVPVSPNTPD
ncbi:MAG: transcriptional regulator [Actinomycetota bacterium]